MSCKYTIGLFKAVMSPKIRKLGRPNGDEKTIIGLPKKRLKRNGPIPFIKKLPQKKEMGWFL